MGLGAVIGGVATIGSALIGSSAASDAADAQVQAANTAAQTQTNIFDKTRSDLQPFMAGGSQAFSQLANIFGFAPQPGSVPNAPGGITSNGQVTNGGGQTINIPGIGNITLPAGSSGAPQTSVGPAGSSGQPNPALATQLLSQFPGYQFGLDQGVQALDRSAASKGLVLSGAQLKDAQAYGQGYAQQNAWQPYVSELNTAAGLGENAAAGAGNIGASTGAGIASSELAAGQASAAGTVGSANQLTSGISQLTSQLQGQFPSSYGSIYGGETFPSITGASSSPLALTGSSSLGITPVAF